MRNVTEYVCTYNNADYRIADASLSDVYSSYGFFPDSQISIVWIKGGGVASWEIYESGSSDKSDVLWKAIQIYSLDVKMFYYHMMLCQHHRPGKLEGKRFLVIGSIKEYKEGRQNLIFNIIS